MSYDTKGYIGNTRLLSPIKKVINEMNDLKKMNIPENKLILNIAFYGMGFSNVSSDNNGLD